MLPLLQRAHFGTRIGGPSCALAQDLPERLAALDAEAPKCAGLRESFEDIAVEVGYPGELPQCSGLGLRGPLCADPVTSKAPPCLADSVCISPAQALYVTQAHAHGTTRPAIPNVRTLPVILIMSGFQSALPPAVANVHRPHLDAVPLCVLHNGRWRIEAHWPGVEQGAGKNVRVVLLDPRSRPGNERKTRRVALGKAVFTETADLIENALGKLRGDPFGGHAGDQPLPVFFNTPTLAPRRHIPTQLVRLAGAVVRGDHGELHDLLLKEGHTERFFQNRPETLVRIDHRLLSGAPGEVGMHHTSGNRTGPHNAHLNDQIVEAPRLQAGQHGHLRPALDLKNADGVGLRYHPENRRVMGGDGGHADLLAVMPPNKSKGKIEVGKSTQTKKINLEEVHVFNVVLVPLDNRSVRHACVLHGHEMGDRPAAEEEAAGMD